MKPLLVELPHVVAYGWDVVDAVAYGVDVHHAASRHECHGIVAAVEHLLQQLHDVLLVHGGIVVLVEVERAYEVVPHPGHLFGGWRRRAYGHASVNLPRVGVDDWHL